MLNSRRYAAAGIIVIILLGAVIAISAVILTDRSSSGDSSNDSSNLDTPIGIFKGTVGTSVHTETSYVAYKGIPFAEPPVGNLRFARPVPVPATVRGQVVNPNNTKSCCSTTKSPTHKFYGEDCLYINIYRPYDLNRQSYSQNILPVMVWLHGGGFVAGSVFPEPIKLVTRGQVIVVMVNYRLGVFGFLTTLSNDLPSNNGLWDQYLAIKWVSDNIRYFNGDRTLITVFGNSAGAMSTAFHVLSPISSPYFTKAILQSGFSTSMISRYPVQRTMEFANLVGCSNVPGNEELVECLRHLTVADILENDKAGSYNLSMAQAQIDFIWTPVIDGEFIIDEPLTLLSNYTYLSEMGVYNKDYIFGILNDDGGLIVNNFLNPIHISNISDVVFYRNLSKVLITNRFGNINGTILTKILESMNEFYVGQKTPTTSISYQSVLDMSTDLVFFVPAVEMALAVSICSKTYAHSCQKDAMATNSSGEDIYCPTLQTSPKIFFYLLDGCPSSKVCDAPCMVHGAEVNSLEFPREITSDEDTRLLSTLFVDILTSFAGDSNPGRALDSGWPQYEPISQSYLSLNPKPSVRKFLYNTRSTFWLKRIFDLLKKVT